jgi:hypothetical protein
MLRYNILIYQPNARIPADLPEFLHAKGYASQVVTDLAYVPLTAAQMRNPILLIDGGIDRSSREAALYYLTEHESLYTMPLIFMVDNVEAEVFQGMLSQFFRLSLVISTESKTREIFSAIEAAVSHYKPKYDYVEISHDDPDAVNWIETSVQEILESFEDFPNFLFDQLHRLEVVDDEIGGAALLSNLSLDDLEHKGLVPEGPALRETVVSVFESLKDKGQEHVARTTYSASAMNRAMQMPEKQERQARSAALLFAWAMSGAASGVLDEKYYPMDGKSSVRVAAKIMDSAEMVRADLKDEDLASLVFGMAEMVGEGKKPEDPLQHALVSSLVAADIANRMCFLNGGWNPRGVHSLMRKIRQGRLEVLHPVALSCLVKFLNEAVAHVQHITGSASGDLEKVGEGLYKVPVIKLKPGMRLAEPLFAKDGKKIAEPDIQLDPDLIWRIWQLAAIRLLRDSFVFSRSDSGE